MARHSEAHPLNPKGISFVWPRLVELWIFGTIATFFVVRILGSHYAQRFLHAIKTGHLA
jgi:hypothetical protein